MPLAEDSAEGREFSLVVMGEKCKVQLQRDQKEKFKLTIGDITKSPPTFAQVISGAPSSDLMSV